MEHFFSLQSQNETSNSTNHKYRLNTNDDIFCTTYHGCRVTQVIAGWSQIDLLSSFNHLGLSPMQTTEYFASLLRST